MILTVSHDTSILIKHTQNDRIFQLEVKAQLLNGTTTLVSSSNHNIDDLTSNRSTVLANDFLETKLETK